MPSKNDNYQSLCLEQALKSPLHYRHGCIIVRGGKIIGKGYNHYRPGFNGGALKNGRLPFAKLNPDAKQKKKKQNSKHIPQSDQLGGGPSANSPLTMHSEMMAIRSALSLSAHENEPSAKRPRGRARAESIPHARQVHREASGVLNRIHIDSATVHNNVPNESKEEKSMKNEKGKNGNEKKGKGDLYGGHHGTQYQYHDDDGNILDRPPEATEKSTTSLASVKDSPTVVAPSTTPLNPRPSSSHSKRKPKSSKPRQHLSTNQPILIPIARAAAKASRLTDRIVDYRLKGADIYVARLAWKRPESPQPRATKNTQPGFGPSSPSSSDDRKSSPTRSLHDELSPLSRCPTPSLPPAPANSSSAPLECATCSRPCYRCISYMHRAGIRRVFWTNADGEWEGGKVRDLVEALEFGGEPAAGAGAGMGMGMFVTKHEVLALRKRMCEG